jgi:hypothetical protein
VKWHEKSYWHCEWVSELQVCNWLVACPCRTVTSTWSRNVYRLLVGKPEGKRPLGRPRRRWIDLLEIGLSVVDWIGLAQDRYRWRALVNSVMNLWVP